MIGLVQTIKDGIPGWLCVQCQTTFYGDGILEHLKEHDKEAGNGSDKDGR